MIEYQAHSGAVNTGSSPKVQYGYADGSANTIRLTALTYPDGRELNYDYGTTDGPGDLLSRVSSLIDDDGSTPLADYTYLGLGGIVEVNFPPPGTRLTYIGGGTGDGGDQYRGWDRFGRVIDQRWLKGGSALERLKFGYDRASNRLWRRNVVAGSGQDEFYTYDGLYQLLKLQRGTLNGNRTGINGTPVWEEDFTFDPTGNWAHYATKVNGTASLNQDRTHNKVNEIRTIDGSNALMKHNAAGNISKAPRPSDWTKGCSLYYDAWQRLVRVKQGTANVGIYRYDGTNRRVSKQTGAATRHYYYTQAWQIVEERLDSATTADRQFVWGLRHLDDLILRDRNTERLYGLQDVFSCTAVTDAVGAVKERYGYDAFGQSRVLKPGFGNRNSSKYDWETRYDSYRFDKESGFYQVRHRYLHPTLGRWTTRDPIDYRSDFNLYRYCNNMPVSVKDSLGLFSIKTEVQSGITELIQKLALFASCCIKDEVTGSVTVKSVTTAKLPPCKVFCCPVIDSVAQSLLQTVVDAALPYKLVATCPTGKTCKTIFKVSEAKLSGDVTVSFPIGPRIDPLRPPFVDIGSPNPTCTMTIAINFNVTAKNVEVGRCK